MSGTGVTDFVSQWMRIPPYIDGVRIDPFDPERPPTWSEDAGGTILLPTHGGTHRMQGIYLGAARALEFAPQEWNFGALVASEEDLFRLKRAKRKGGRVIFAPFVWEEEVFAAVSGETYQLSRPVAYGIAIECDRTSYPVRAFLADADSDSSITLASGDLPQTFVANDTGLITVRYPPAYRVKVNSVQLVMSTHNKLVVTFGMSEAVSV